MRIIKNDNAVFKFIFEQLSLSKKLSIDDLGFLIGPIINSGGRLGYSNAATELLTSNNMQIIKKRSQELIVLNDNPKRRIISIWYSLLYVHLFGLFISGFISRFISVISSLLIILSNPG